jgi:hypothetical protein
MCPSSFRVTNARCTKGVLCPRLINSISGFSIENVLDWIPTPYSLPTPTTIMMQMLGREGKMLKMLDYHLS